jgi:two-component system, NtrC family, response regulator PilR
MGTKPMQPKRVLVVDDEEEIRELLCLQLSRKGLGCDIAGGVAEAHALLSDPANDYGAILCDYSMKDGTGLEVFESMKSRSSILFVLISGFSEIGEEELRAKGIVHILNKPVKFQELFSLVQAHTPKS